MASPSWIERQLARRGITDERVLTAMERVPRELFVPEEHRGIAYDDAAILDAYPDGRTRAEAALRNRNAGEVLLSAAPGYEFADLGGRHHAGGGSHGSLAAADSEVPMLTVGTGHPPPSITGIKGLLLEHFGLTVAEAA